jgi:hypothetical protein
MVKLKDMLQSLAGSTSKSGSLASRRACQTTHQPGELPADIKWWPTEWHSRYRLTASTIKQLLPIEDLFAEAAAEIAVRCEYSRQVSERS